MSESVSQNSTPELPPIKVAFVIDNKVVDVLHTDERLSAIFLSQPTIVDVTEWYLDEANTGKTLVDASYDSNTDLFTLG